MNFVNIYCKVFDKLIYIYNNVKTYEMCINHNHNINNVNNMNYSLNYSNGYIAIYVLLKKYCVVVLL